MELLAEGRDDMDLLTGTASAAAVAVSSAAAAVASCSGLLRIFVNGDRRVADDGAAGGRANDNVLAVGLRLVIRPSWPSREPLCESLLPELLNGLPSCLSRPSGDGGSDVTL